MKKLKKYLNIFLSCLLLSSSFLIVPTKTMAADLSKEIVSIEGIYSRWENPEYTVRYIPSVYKISYANGNIQFISLEYQNNRLGSQLEKAIKSKVYTSEEQVLVIGYNPNQFVEGGDWFPSLNLTTGKVNIPGNFPTIDIQFNKFIAIQSNYSYIIADTYKNVTFYGLSRDGYLYSWGKGSEGQLGGGETIEFLSEPERVKDPSNPSKYLEGVKGMSNTTMRAAVFFTDKKEAFFLGSRMNGRSLVANKNKLPDMFPNIPNIMDPSKAYFLAPHYIENPMTFFDGKDFWNLVQGSNAWDKSPSTYPRFNVDAGTTYDKTPIYYIGEDLFDSTVEGKVNTIGLNKVLFTNSGVIAIGEDTSLYAYNRYSRTIFSDAVSPKVFKKLRMPSGGLSDIKDVSYLYNTFFIKKNNGSLYSAGISDTSLKDISSTYNDIVIPSEEFPAGQKENQISFFFYLDKSNNLYADSWGAPNAMNLGLSDMTLNLKQYPAESQLEKALSKPIVTATKEANGSYLVSVDYSDATVKEYSTDNGNTWQTYTSSVPFVNNGSFTFKARAGNGTSFEESDNINFIVNTWYLEADYPKIIGNDGIVSVDMGSSTGDLKIVISIDGGAEVEYTGPITLSEGAHDIVVKVLSPDTNLIKTVTGNVSGLASKEITPPNLSVDSLDNNGRIIVKASWNSSEGDLYTSTDDTNYILNSSPDITIENNNSIVYAKVVKGAKESNVSYLNILKVRPTLSVKVDNSLSIGNSGMFEARGFTLSLKVDNSTFNLNTDKISKGEHSVYLEYKNTDDAVVFSDTYLVSGYDLDNTDNGGTPIVIDPEVNEPLGSQEVELNVRSGGMSARFEGVDLSVIKIDSLKEYQSINSVSKAFIENSTGEVNGWDYSLSVTDFISDPLTDASTDTKDLVLKIPATALTVNVKNAKSLGGQPAPAYTIGSRSFIPGQSRSLASANKFEGMGYYEIPLEMGISIPSKLKVVSSNVNSNYKVDSDSGLRTGTFRSTFKFELTQGI